MNTDRDNQETIEHFELRYFGQLTNDTNKQIKTIYLPNGDKYKGYVVLGKPEGHGIRYMKNKSVYLGEFKGGEFSGAGCILYNNGDRFEGAFEFGQKNGQGTLTIFNGTN